MAKKIEELAQSIKTKLSFDDYTPSTHNTITPDAGNTILPDCNNDIIMVKRKAVKKVKRTFYILEGVAEQLDDLYAKLLTQKKKVDKSDIITQALLNLFEDPEAEIERF